MTIRFKVCVDLFYFQFDNGRGYFFDDAEDRYSSVFASRDEAKEHLERGSVPWKPVGEVPSYHETEI